MDIIKKIERENMRMDMPVFRSGDTVKVHLRIVEGEKERIQVFQGNVIRIQRGTTDATFTVRKISDGVGVERIFPLHSPLESQAFPKLKKCSYVMFLYLPLIEIYGFR